MGMKCKACSSEIDELAVFPGGICVACHEKRFDAELRRTGILPRPDFIAAINLGLSPAPKLETTANAAGGEQRRSVSALLLPLSKPTKPKPMRKKTKQAPSVPTCAFCKRSGTGITFAMFNPRFQPFGTACTECEATLPPGTANPVSEK